MELPYQMHSYIRQNIQEYWITDNIDMDHK